MTTGKKIILALAVIALLIGAWFVAYHNHKSTSNLPQLSAIALMDEADVNELLVGYYRTQLPDVWGGPDPELSGENTWVWKIDDNTLLTVSSNKVGEKAKIVSTSVDSVFKAEVLEIGKGYILVKPLDGTREAAEYSVFPEPGVRRVRATIPAGQSQCSGRREPVSFPLLLCITTGCAEHGGQGCCAWPPCRLSAFSHEFASHALTNI